MNKEAGRKNTNENQPTMGKMKHPQQKKESLGNRNHQHATNETKQTIYIYIYIYVIPYVTLFIYSILSYTMYVMHLI